MTKSKKKLGIIAIVSLLLAVFVVSAMPLTAHAEESSIPAISGKIESNERADYIASNLDKVREQYNSAVGEEVFKAQSIESRKEVILTDTNEYAVYLDFDGDNGYLLVDGKNNLFEFETDGDLEYLRTVDTVYYNDFDKFMYFDNESSTLQVYENQYNNSSLLSQAQCIDGIDTDTDNLGAPYNGQPNAGDGYIYDIEAYVSDRYPSYSRDYSDWYVIRDYAFKNQFNTSLYQEHRDGGKIYSEGNCVINATYSMMCDWQRKGIYSSLPTSTADLRSSISSDRQYHPYGDGTNSAWSINYSYILQAIPNLYLQIRNYAIDYGYKPENGMQFKYVSNMVSNVAANNGLSISMTQSSSFDGAKASIRSNRAATIGVNKSSSYNNHGMALIGYMKYTYKSGWWIFSSTKTAYFFAVDDCHGTSNGSDYNRQLHVSADTLSSVYYRATWYDPNAGASNTYIYRA